MSGTLTEKSDCAAEDEAGELCQSWGGGSDRVQRAGGHLSEIIHLLPYFVLQSKDGAMIRQVEWQKAI